MPNTIDNKIKQILVPSSGQLTGQTPKSTTKSADDADALVQTAAKQQVLVEQYLSAGLRPPHVAHGPQNSSVKDIPNDWNKIISRLNRYPDRLAVNNLKKNIAEASAAKQQAALKLMNLFFGADANQEFWADDNFCPTLELAMQLEDNHLSHAVAFAQSVVVDEAFYEFTSFSLQILQIVTKVQPQDAAAFTQLTQFTAKYEDFSDKITALNALAEVPAAARAAVVDSLQFYLASEPWAHSASAVLQALVKVAPEERPGLAAFFNFFLGSSYSSSFISTSADHSAVERDSLLRFAYSLGLQTMSKYERSELKYHLWNIPPIERANLKACVHGVLGEDAMERSTAALVTALYRVVQQQADTDVLLKCCQQMRPSLTSHVAAYSYERAVIEVTHIAPEVQRVLEARGVFAAAGELRAPQLLAELFAYIGAHVAEAAVQPTVWPAKLTQRKGLFPLILQLCAHLQSESVNVAPLVQRLAEQPRAYRDGPKARALLRLLLTLLQDDKLRAADKSILLTKLDDPAAVVATQSLLDMQGGEMLLSESATAAQALENCTLNRLQGFAAVVNKQPADILASFNATFGQCRRPQAIWQYLGVLTQGGDKALLDAFQRYFFGVLDGTFLEQRYALADNPHLAMLEKARPGILAAWRQRVEIAATQVGEDTAAETSPLAWLQERLDDGHLGSLATDTLRAGLQARTNGDLAAVSNATRQAPAEAFTALCFALVDVPQRDHAGQKKALLALQQYLQAQQIDCEFNNDVKGWLRLLNDSGPAAKDKRFRNTDDPYDLLLCGTEIPGSCMRVDGYLDNNQGLLGYLLHGQVQALNAIDTQGNPQSRCLLRLLWCPARAEPMLFLERTYPDAKDQRGLTVLAQQKAQAMGLRLAQLPRDDSKAASLQPSVALISLGGPAPYEYVDALEGNESDGKYTIYAASIIFEPTTAH